MKNEKSSYNTARLTVMSRRFLFPSWPKILLYFLVGGLLLLLWNGKAIRDQFNSTYMIQSGNLSPHQSGWLEIHVHDLVNGRLAQIVFWAFAGCAVYVCIWFITTIFGNIRNDIVADEFVHPADYTRKGYWSSVLARKGFLVAVIVTLLGYVVTMLQLTPALAHVFMTALQPFQWSPSLGELLGSIAAAAVMLYLLALLVHIAFNSWRAIYADL